MKKYSAWLLAAVLAASCGTKQESAPATAKREEPPPPIKPLDTDDDQPITVIGGSIGVLSEGEWAWDGATKTSLYIPSKTALAESIMVFLTDAASTSTDADSEATITPLYTATDGLKIEVYRKASPMADPVATLTTDVQTGMNLKLALRNPRRFKRFYFNGGNGINIAKIVFTSVTGNSADLAKVGCTMNTNKITCVDAKGTPAGLGFVIHVK
jgi:hypothetical protein